MDEIKIIGVGERTPLRNAQQGGPHSKDRGGSSPRKRIKEGLMSAPSELHRFLFRHLHMVCLLTYIGAQALSVLCFSYWIEEWPIVESLYFGTVSMTTVGYGDIAPTSTEGRVGAMLLTLLGIAMVLGILNKSIEQHFSRRRWWDELITFVHVALLFATWLIARVEGWDFFTACYYFVVTGTTLGYGDVSPQSESAKAICVVYIPALVISFALFVTDKLTHFCTEHLDKDTLIKEWIDEKGLTIEGFRTLDIGSDKKVQYTEFLLGMVNYFHEAYGKIPDKRLVEQLKEKFEDLDCDGTQEICENDISTYQKQLRDAKDGENTSAKLNLNGFFEMLLLHFDEIPPRDRDAKRIHVVICEMFEERLKEGGENGDLETEGTVAYTAGNEDAVVGEFIERLKKFRNR